MKSQQVSVDDWIYTDQPFTEADFWAEFGGMSVDEDTEATTPEEVSVLRDYLSGKLSVVSAARELMSLREDKCPLIGRWDKSERVSYLLYGACLFFAEKQVELLTLVKKIREMGEELLLSLATEEQRVRLDKTWPPWRQWMELEDFDNYRRDRYDFYKHWRYPGGGFDAPARQFWIMWNAFLAHQSIMFRKSHSEIYRAFTCIKEALEHTPWVNAHPERKKYPRHEDYVTVLNTAVAPLLPWFQIAGRLIYNWQSPAARIHDPFNPHEVYSQEGWYASMSSEEERSISDITTTETTTTRWQFWKLRLHWISIHSDLRLETRETALKVLQCMEALEAEAETETQEEREKWKTWIQIDEWVPLDYRSMQWDDFREEWDEADRLYEVEFERYRAAQEGGTEEERKGEFVTPEEEKESDAEVIL